MNDINKESHESISTEGQPPNTTTHGEQSTITPESQHSVAGAIHVDHYDEHPINHHPPHWYQNPVVQTLLTTIIFAVISGTVIGLLNIFAYRVGEFIKSRTIFTASISDDILLGSAKRMRSEAAILPPKAHNRILELAKNLEQAAVELKEPEHILLKSANKSTSLWLQVAMAEHSRQKKLGDQHDDKILEYIVSVNPEAIKTPPKTNIAWSSHFVNWVLQNAKMIGTNNEQPSSWLNWGKAITEPKHGAIAVFRMHNHNNFEYVGFMIADTTNYVIVLAGDILNSIGVVAFNKKDLLGYRWAEMSSFVVK